MSVLMDALMTRDDLARYLGVARKTVERWARAGIGPQEIRIRGVIRYRRADVEEWLTRQQQGGGDTR